MYLNLIFTTVCLVNRIPVRFISSSRFVACQIVKDRLAQSDAQERGWLLDGYPRSASQAAALEAAGIKPQLFILLEVGMD